MNAYYFRSVDSGGTPTGYFGLAAAPDWSHLFWEIDQFIDPYRVEIRPAQFASYCYKVTVEVAEEDSDYEHVERESFEFNEREPLFEEKRWRRPNWKAKGVPHGRGAEP